jgi:hypothetical protein
MVEAIGRQAEERWKGSESRSVPELSTGMRAKEWLNPPNHDLAIDILSEIAVLAAKEQAGRTKMHASLTLTRPNEESN